MHKKVRERTLGPLGTRQAIRLRQSEENQTGEPFPLNVPGSTIEQRDHDSESRATII